MPTCFLKTQPSLQELRINFAIHLNVMAGINDNSIILHNTTCYIHSRLFHKKCLVTAISQIWSLTPVGDVWTVIIYVGTVYTKIKRHYQCKLRRHIWMHGGRLDVGWKKCQSCSQENTGPSIFVVLSDSWKNFAGIVALSYWHSTISSLSVEVTVD